MTTPKIKAYHGPGGALVTDRPVDGFTRIMCDNSSRFYGGFHMVAESMNRATAVLLSTALELELVDTLFVEPRGASPLQGQEGEKS